MGQYKFIVSFSWSFGLLFEYEPCASAKSFSIFMPFVRLYFGLTEYAKGVRIFEREI